MRKGWLRGVLVLLGASAIWLPNVHRFYAPDAKDRTHFVKGATERALASDDTAKMRAVNPEWDFMRRTYTVMALANLALRDEAQRPALLAKIDALVDDTLRSEREEG